MLLKIQGNLDTSKRLKNFYNETIEKLNGKFVFEDYIKKREFSIDNVDIEKQNVNDEIK